MQKVLMKVHGREALVDVDMVSKVSRKENLVSLAMALQEALRNEVFVGRSVLERELNATMRKIRRINKTIRKNVQFI